MIEYDVHSVRERESTNERERERERESETTETENRTVVNFDPYLSTFGIAWYRTVDIFPVYSHCTKTYCTEVNGDVSVASFSCNLRTHSIVLSIITIIVCAVTVIVHFLFCFFYADLTHIYRFTSERERKRETERERVVVTGIAYLKD